jgi:hypothetical protein
MALGSRPRLLTWVGTERLIWSSTSHSLSSTFGMPSAPQICAGQVWFVCQSPLLQLFSNANCFSAYNSTTSAVARKARSVPSALSPASSTQPCHFRHGSSTSSHLGSDGSATPASAYQGVLLYGRRGQHILAVSCYVPSNLGYHTFPVRHLRTLLGNGYRSFQPRISYLPG